MLVDSHFHNPTMNFTFVNGKWCTLKTDHLMKWKTSANAIYMAALTENIKKLGIELEYKNNTITMVKEK